MLRVQLSAKGRAAHSAVPEHGDSAIDKLVDVLVRLRGMQWPSDPELGNTFYSIGLIEGGIAPNVISPSASAELMFRIVGSADEVLARAREVEPNVTVTEILRVPMVRFHTVPGIPAAVFPFTTDVPLLNRWGTPLLFGPGSILVAHTQREHVHVDEVHAAIGTYARLASHCLSAA